METIRALEERLVNVWPAVHTLLMDGWVVRFANGYSGRANSASAVVTGATMPPALLDEIERLYADAGMKPQVRVTPVADAAVEPLLVSRGYRVKDASRIMSAPLADFADKRTDPRITLEPKPERAWLDGVSVRQEVSKRSPDHLAAIVGQIRVPAAFATLRLDGEAIGFAMVAIDRGWAEIGSVMLDAGYRGKGLGRATVNALMVWAAQNGAHHAFLQVDGTNSVAINLYRSMGFVDLGGYKTMVLG
ncbi:MAG: GNAT family N-acetyltransferase [Beijerinckiaceae bacterium]